VLAREWGCDLEAHRTRPFRDEAARAADLILAMDVVQGRAVAQRWPSIAGRVRMLGDFLPVRPFAIVDPWAYAEPVWRDTYARLHEAVRRLAARLGDSS
jgi:protein-tyrosine-phosphatase